MNYEVLYRKYRPHVFDDVVGQKHVVDTLVSQIEQGTPSHAYLFFGSRGIGKTSIARIFGRSLGISDIDVYEIDAASNRGIEDIRDLREAVRTASSIAAMTTPGSMPFSLASASMVCINGFVAMFLKTPLRDGRAG